jgi:hypothetical protein
VVAVVVVPVVLLLDLEEMEPMVLDMEAEVAVAGQLSEAVMVATEAMARQELLLLQPSFKQ